MRADQMRKCALDQWNLAKTMYTEGSQELKDAQKECLDAIKAANKIATKGLDEYVAEVKQKMQGGGDDEVKREA